MIKTSINIKYDIKNKNLVKDYFATSSHSEIIKSVLKSVAGHNALNSNIAYGPYGAGKSYISALLVSLTTNSLTKGNLDMLKKKFSIVDDNISEYITNLYTQKKKVIDVVINGSEGDFKSTLLNSINRVLIKSKIKINFPGVNSEMIKTIKRWETSYPNTYTEFLFAINDKNYELIEFMKKLELGDKNSIEIFEKVYTNLTAGSIYHANFDSSIDDILLSVCKQLEKKNYHLLIVWDEFGRVLQNLHLAEINNFMQEIQDIAELSNNGVKNLTTLFVAHKPLGFYFNFATKELRDEFAKVEKRFNVIEIRSDYNTFLQITAKVIKSLNITSNVQKSELDKLRKFNVFSNYLNDTELINLVGNQSYPLHPITLFTLPKLSSIFGQNERTLFSFLYDNSSNGLIGHLESETKYYYVDKLVDYFFTNIDKSYIEDIEIFNIYSSNIHRIKVLIDTDSEICERVYKFTMIWRLISGNHMMKLTDKLTAYALGLEVGIVENSLALLAKVKLVRFNDLHSEWEIFKGSNLDLEQEILISRSKLKITRLNLINLFNDRNPFRYIYSEKHNAKNEITRFAIMEIGTGTNKINENFDFSVVLNLENETIKRIPISNRLDIQLDFDFSEIETSLTNLYILDYIKTNDYYKREYPGIEADIEYLSRKIEKKMFDYYNRIFLGEFYYKNSKVKITNSKELNEFLTVYFDKTFDKYPIVVNDQINMFKISSVQFGAFSKVFGSILNQNEKEQQELYIGSTPADLIYKSVIENINLIDGNQNKLNDMKKKLKSHLRKTPKGKLIDLIRLVSRPPFGLRPYIATLLVFKLIKNEWNDMLLFIGDTYIPSIKVNDLIEYLFNDSEKLIYSFSYFDNKNRDYLVHLESIFETDNQMIINKSLSVRVCSNMHEWYVNLPTVTQQATNMGISDRVFLNIIKSSHTNPTLAIEKLSNDFTLDDISDFKKSIDEHFINFINRFKNTIKNKIGTKDLLEWASKQDKVQKKTNKLVNGIINKKNIFEIYSDDTDNLEIVKWTNSSFNMLKNMAIEDYKKLQNSVEVDTVIVNGNEKFVQKVELSSKAKVTQENLVNLINATSQYLTDNEIEKIILDLISKYIS